MTEDHSSRDSPRGTPERLSDPEAPTLLDSTQQRRPVPPQAPRVPNYRILELLGTGGMGEVWAAEQERPIQRKVALKVIKLGMDSRQIVSRFQYERRALAMMSHPNIASVYEAGTTSDGRPYFAMEYVPGEPVSSYCDRYKLPIRQRLELFLKICDGVQHAHQKGVIHRDLKPSNVLVTVQDEEPLPKIVDFGLAKATSAHQAETVHTAIGDIVGTLEYMSPEQLDLTGLDIDTRSDIYSLGVLLYHLLVGAVPFPQQEMKTSGLDGLRRIIREQDPAKPSTRVATVHETSPSMASERGHNHEGLVRRLRGDLDWITLKALEKDRTRRYQTANALAMDIRRHLADEPVLARPPSTIYKARKFVRRHRAGVVAALLVALALVAGAIGTTMGLVRALRAERRATQQAEAARQISDFLVEIFRVADPDRAEGETITARQILDEGSRRIAHELRQQPETRARLMNTMGTVYRHLGLYAESRQLLEDSLELRRDRLGEETAEVAESLAALAALEMLEGRHGRARALAERALQIRETSRPRDPLKLADSIMLLGWVHESQARHLEAKPLFERALAIRLDALGADSSEVAESHHGLGLSLSRLGDYDEAEKALRVALETYERVLGRDDSRLGGILNDLAALYQETGGDSKALPLLRRALAIKERVLGPLHPDVASSLNNLAIAYDRDDRPVEAGPLFARALEIIESAYGADHELTALALANVAWITYRQGDPAEAEMLYRRALATYERTVGREHRNVAILLQDWSSLHADRGAFERAEGLLAEAARIWEATAGPGHPGLAACLAALEDLYRRQGQPERAEAVRRRIESIRETG